MTSREEEEEEEQDEEEEEEEEHGEHRGRGWRTERSVLLNRVASYNFQKLFFYV